MSNNALGLLVVPLAAIILFHARGAAADGGECRPSGWRYVDGKRVVITIDDGSVRLVVPPDPTLVLRFDWRRQLYAMPSYRYEGHQAWIGSQYVADCRMLVQSCVATDASGDRKLSTRGLQPSPEACLDNSGVAPER